MGFKALASRNQRKRSYGSLSRNQGPAENTLIAKRRAKEDLQMSSSTLGKAWSLVEGAISLETEHIKMIAQDDIISLAERLLIAQTDYSRQNIPVHVDIAYHHTSCKNLKTIITNGLLSRSERKRHLPDVFPQKQGIKHGDGIYCSACPSAYANGFYGDTTILLVRLKGKVCIKSRGESPFNTFAVPHRQICVLQRCNQSIPLFQFPLKLLKNNADFLSKLSEFHEKVQRLLDKIFNRGIHTPVNNDWARPSLKQVGSRQRRHNANGFTRQVRTNSLRFQPSVHNTTLFYNAPDSLEAIDKFILNRPPLTSTLLAENCQVCLKPLINGGKVVQIKRCGHVYHKACLQKTMEHNPSCPTCHVSISNGTMPSGSMIVHHCLDPCAGFEGSNTIVISYSFPSSV